MSKIKILLSCGSVIQNYVDAVKKMGADVTAAYLPQIDNSYDGLLLCGGNDVDPARYSEVVNGAVDIDFKRDSVEFALLEAYIKAGKPVMGICRGHQLINVFFGGSLYQDLPEADLHVSKNGQDSIHEVTALKNSIVGKIYGEAFATNSSHHQCVKELGAGLRATAYWNGKYIEAIEHTLYPIFGVQWHPERMCFNFQREDTVCGADILKYFIEICERYRNK